MPLVIAPFRSLLHMETDADRRAVVRAVHGLLEPGGQFVFDVFWPGPEDISETHGRWLEREPGIFERADWDEERRTLILRVRGEGMESELSLAWISISEWRELARQRGLLGRRPLRLVRRHAVERPRGLDLGLPETRLKTRRARRSGAATRRARSRPPRRRSAIPTRSGSRRRDRARPQPAAPRARRPPGRSPHHGDRPPRSASRPRDERHPLVRQVASSGDFVTWSTSVVSEREQRHAPDGAGGRAERLRASRVGAAVRERDRGAEGVGGADQRADVPGVGDPPEREDARARARPPADPPAGRRRSPAAGARPRRPRRAARPTRSPRPRAARPALRSRRRRDPRPRRRTARASRASAARAACERASASRCRGT